MTAGRIGVDLGGTKIEAAVLIEGEIAARTRVETPKGDYDGTIRRIVEVVEKVGRQAGLSSDTPVGVGTPGSVDRRSGLHRNSNSTCLNDRPFEADLASALARPLRTTNDADCFALSEAADGAGAGADVVFGVILGTGVGGGVVFGGDVHEGRNGLGGEWGHIGLPHRGDRSVTPRPCYCGHVDCLEQYLSGPALEAEYRHATGRDLTLAEIVAREDDPEAVAVLDRLVDRLAESLVSVVNVLDPDVIVLGGGVSNVDRLYRDVPPLLHRRAFGGKAETPVVRNRHGDSSGVRGAAWLWPDPASR